MPKLIDVVVRRAEPHERDRWFADGGGLRLLVKPNGAPTEIFACPGQSGGNTVYPSVLGTP